VAAQPPAVRENSRALTREADPTEIAASARRGALPTSLATVAVLGAGALIVQAGAMRALGKLVFGMLPGVSAFAVANGILLALPAVLPVAMARLLRGRMRAETARSPELGRAAAAGACLGVTGVATLGYGGLFLAYGQLAHPGQVMFWLAGLPLGIAMAIGVLGAMLFRDVEEAAGDQARPLPVVYPGLVAAGAIGPAALGSLAVAGVVLTPFLLWLRSLVPLTSFHIAAWMATTYACFLPMAYLVPRQVRRAFPSARTRAVALGVAIPGVLYAFTDLARILTRTGGPEQLALLAGLAVSLGAWVALAFRGARAGEPEKGAPALPAE
jgi:hypothetical protein